MVSGASKKGATFFGKAPVRKEASWFSQSLKVNQGDDPDEVNKTRKGWWEWRKFHRAKMLEDNSFEFRFDWNSISDYLRICVCLRRIHCGNLSTFDEMCVPLPITQSTLVKFYSYSAYLLLKLNHSRHPRIIHVWSRVTNLLKAL